VRIGAAPSELPALVKKLGKSAARVNGALYARRIFDDLSTRVLALVREAHATAALEAGTSLQSLRAKLHAPEAVADAVIKSLTDDGKIEVDGALVRRKGWRPTLDAAQDQRRDTLLETLRAAGREPPSVSELEAKLGKGCAPLLRLLERERLVVGVEADRWYAREALDGMVEAMRTGLERGREYSPSELRDVLGISRKFLIPFLEYCDRVGITDRRAQGRILSDRFS